MKTLSRLMLVGAMCGLVMTLSPLTLQNGETELQFKSSDLQQWNFEQNDEASGGSHSKVNKDIERKSNIFNLESTVYALLSGKIELSVKFDANFPWHEKFFTQSDDEKRDLVKALGKYVGDLLVKLKINNMKIQVQSLVLTPTSYIGYTHFYVLCECQSVAEEVFIQTHECHNESEKVLMELNMNDLLIYFNEAGYSEVINPDLFQPLEKLDPIGDFFFVEQISDVVEHETSNIETNFPDLFNDLSSSDESLQDDYREENYETVDSNEYGDSDVSDLLVNLVKPLSGNTFEMLAYITPVINVTENFKHEFKTYVEDSHKSNDMFPETKITVEVISAEENEFGNETNVWFKLQTSNIEITEEDLNLDSGNYTTFDQLFEFFDVSEFESQFLENVGIEAEITMENILTEDVNTERMNGTNVMIQLMFGAVSLWNDDQENLKTPKFNEKKSLPSLDELRNSADNSGLCLRLSRVARAVATFTLITFLIDGLI